MTNRASRIAGSDLRALVMSGRLPPRQMPPSQPPQGVSPALFKRQQLWFKLAAYRPLAVLASIWVGLLAIAFLAYGQLLQTSSEHHSSSAPPKAEVYPHERVHDGAPTTVTPAPASPESADNQSSGEATPAVPAEVAESDAGISVWTLAALVGTCALGCWLLSLQLKKPPKPRKKKVKRPSRPPQKRLVSSQSPSPRATNPSASTAATPQRLAPYDPNQPLVAAPSPQPASQGTASAMPPPASPEPASDVTVVSSGFQHRLDWPEDSLVNTADVRQRRSLSSYM